MRRFAAVCSALFSMTAACGDDGAHNTLPDAPIGGSDGPVGDAPPAAGTVNILATARGYTGVAPGTPVQNVLVVALQKDGSLAGSAMTGADGKAALTGINEGASVTAVYPDGFSRRDVVTYAAVKPGDTLTFGDRYYVPDAQGAEGELSVSWPAVTGASYYYLYSPCSYGGGTSLGNVTSTTVSLYDYCQTPTAPLVLSAYDEDGELVSSIHLPAAPYTGTTEIALTAAQWLPAADLAVGVTALPGVASSVYLGIYEDFHGLYDQRERYTAIDANAASRTFKVSDPTTATAYAQIYRSGDYGSKFSYKRGPSPALTVPTMPWIGGLVANSSQAAWVQSAGSTYDAAVLRFGWYTSVKGGNDQSWNWNIILPPGQSFFAFPTPPAELAALLPSDTTTVNVDLTFIDLASAASYDAIRALPEYRATDAGAAVRRGDETAVTSSVADGGEGSGFAPPP